MKLFKIILLLTAGLGTAWGQGDQPEVEQPAVEQPAVDQPEVEQLSQEELDAEMQRMEEALNESGLGESDEIREFIPTKPLSADLPIALPSDI
jgi:hypothetical protein